MFHVPGFIDGHVGHLVAATSRQAGEEEVDIGSFLCCSGEHFARAINTGQCNNQEHGKFRKLTSEKLTVRLGSTVIYFPIFRQIRPDFIGGMRKDVTRLKPI